MEQQRNFNDNVKIALLSPGSILHVPFANRDTVRDSLKESRYLKKNWTKIIVQTPILSIKAAAEWGLHMKCKVILKRFALSCDISQTHLKLQASDTTINAVHSKIWHSQSRFLL